jgi:hypothetical protein
MKLYMFRTVRLSVIRSLFTVHSAMVYVIQVCRQLSSRTRMELQKYVKLVHLVGFITKNIVTMHGHVNVKLLSILVGKRWRLSELEVIPIMKGNFLPRTV